MLSKLLRVAWQPLLRYQYCNRLGSSSLELDDNATIISYEEYHPFGTTAYQAMNANLHAAAKRYRYTGMERDEESGLEYHTARYYLPWLGRWLSADPIGIQGGINLYVYAGNNPVSRTDTKGTDWKEDIFGDIKTAKVGKNEYGEVTAKGVLIAYDKKDHPGDRIFIPFGKSEPTYIHTQKNWFKITAIKGDNISYESVNSSSKLWVRISGLAELVGGALGAAGGVVFGVATAETGVGPVAGAAFSTWSTDHAIRGFGALVSGKEGRTYTARILSGAMSDKTADKVDDISYFVASFLIAYGNAKLPSAPQIPGANAGQVALKTGSGSGKGWFSWWRDEGGWTAKVSDDGLSYYSGPKRWLKGYRSTIRNYDADLGSSWASIRDTHYHEAFHAFIMKYLPAYSNLAHMKLGPVPVGAPLRYLDEVGAYTFGHLMTGRLHAIPFAPVEAIGSLTRGQALVMGAVYMGLGGLAAYELDDRISVPGNP